jgi:hypothetical protein
MEIVLTTPAELQNIIRAAMIDQQRQMESSSNPKLYSINKVAKRLGKSHATISKLVEAGIIKSTRNGLITEQAINDYLENK